MERLRILLQQTEKILSNPYESFTPGRNENFDARLLKCSLGQQLPEGFEVGSFISSTGENIPAFLPFSSTNGIAFSIEKVSDFAFFNELLERATFQVLNAIGYSNFKLTLLDGKNHGIFLSHLSQFDDAITSGKIHKEPGEINKALNTIALGKNKEYQFIIINNFPHGFANDSIAALIQLLNFAHEKNIKILMTKEMEPMRSIADLDASISSKLETISFDRNNQWRSKTLNQITNIKELFTLNFGSSFTDNDMQSAIRSAYGMAKATENATKENFDISDGIKIPFGEHHNKIFYFRLGHSATNFHAIIGGRSGKGKTVFLDNIISRATSIYSPDDLRFVLLDMKGIEFGAYRDSPHVQAFCSSTNCENAMKIIEFLQGELKNREVLFKQAGSRNITEFKKTSGNVMPRLLVILDEFQNLFTGNYKSDAFVEEILIKQILRMGRAYGIHLICSTQSLGDGVRSSFLNNIPLRIAFQMTQDQSRSFLSINNPAAEALKVGEAIYNEQDGVVHENILVKVNNLQNDGIQKYLTEFINSNISYQLFERLIL